MTSSLRSVSSRAARKRKRGESEEDYAKRIARLEQKRASAARVKDRLREDTISLDVSSDVAVETPLPVIERILVSHNDELRRAESQVSSLVKQLERERLEKQRLEAQLADALSSLSYRNHYASSAAPSKVEFVEQGVEIIDLSEIPRQQTPDVEIIEFFGDERHAPETLSASRSKLLNVLDKIDTKGHPESDPASPPSSPLKGVSVGRGRATHRAPSWGGAAEQTEQSEPGAGRISLAEAAEMLLWVGWVDRARREFPLQPLFVRFGERERRVWSDVVGSTAEFVGCDDVGQASETIPFGFELAWTLRYALDSLPACAPVLDVCWRFMAGFMKPQPRTMLGVLSGADRVEVVKRRFLTVDKEIERGTLIIDRSST